MNVYGVPTESSTAKCGAGAPGTNCGSVGGGTCEVPSADAAIDEGAVVGAGDAEGATVGPDAAHAPSVTLAVAATSQNAQRGRPGRPSVAVLAAIVSPSFVGV
jgi:hypothetical protein